MAVQRSSFGGERALRPGEVAPFLPLAMYSGVGACSRGTNDPAEAAKDTNDRPISNSARNIWITETALATALDMGFMSEMLSIFSVVVGIALLLTGIGLVILALAVFGRWRPVEAAPAPAPVPGAAAA